MVQITFLGNFHVPFSSESHHAATLESLGHRVIRLQEGESHSSTILDWAKNSDLFVWVHTHGWLTPGEPGMTKVLKTLKSKGVPTVTYHLDLWFGINRQKDLEDDEFYQHIGHFFTVDRKMADWFNANTEVKGHYLRAGVYEPECYMAAPSKTLLNDVVFVGSRGYHPEWSWRPRLVDFLKNTYGDRFKHYGGDGLGVVRGAALNQLYADTKVVVGDSLVINYDYPDYWSDRVYETTGRGGFLLMPKIKGLETEFGPDELDTFEFGNFGSLKAKINYYLEHDQEREFMQVAAHIKTKDNYTYTHRWQTILTELELV